MDLVSNEMGTRKRERLDRLLVERNLAETREQARRMILAGEVLADDQVSDKPGKQVLLTSKLRVRARPRYVSRGGLKLEKALNTFSIDPAGKIVLDVGASTGGFTDCLLQRGAARVFAVDVGYGQLAWKLRQDERVVILERTNIRHLAALPDQVLADLAVIDTSFIGLALVLPATLRLIQPEAGIIALVKPQFEAGPENVGKGGVVRETKIHQQILQRIVQLAQNLDLNVAGLTISPIKGPAGNIEFLLWLQRAGAGLNASALSRAIQNVLIEPTAADFPAS